MQATHTSPTSCGIVLCKIEKTWKYGCGTVVRVKNSLVVVTAAHVVQTEEPDNKFFVTEGTTTHSIRKVTIHPDFPKSHYDSKSGYDIAILMLGEQSDSSKIEECKNLVQDLWSKNSTELFRSPTVLSGSEPKCEAGCPVILGACCDEAEDTSIWKIFGGSSRSGKLVAYKDIHTTHGHSGLPIFLKGPGSTLQLVGVHCGVHQIDKFGFATWMTKHIRDWMMKLH